MDIVANSTLGSIGTAIGNLRTKIIGVNDKLNGKHLPAMNDDREALLQYVTTHREDLLFLNEIQAVLLSALEACDQIDELNQNQHQVWQDEQDRQASVQLRSLKHERVKRQAERADMWYLWLHQTARWLAGAILVFLMYSSAVWLSEHTKFFHVPIKDLFPKISEQPKA
ncbi:hypothetical protein [Pseudoduganella violaceinigra]|uniref:hypothetical protein n=1 Tax=Pseudoduganella violaceinigra TaxID=246602 RepID=UPI0004802CEB|nr:hypothetical protein [Pseudoduganella violaceinigra]